MSAAGDLRSYRARHGTVNVAMKLARRGSQHARYLLSRAAGRHPTFEYHGESMEFFWHPYNRTWLNERALEIPIARAFIARFGEASNGLEIGNVMSHYQPVSHRVVDKYEVSPGVENLDVVDVATDRPLDFAVTISTIEHVGWDEPDRDLGKAPAAVQHLRSLLDPVHGRLLLSAPLGHNPGLDNWLLQGAHGALTSDIYVRDHRGRWSHTERVEPHQIRYLYNFSSAGCLWIGEFARA